MTLPAMEKGLVERRWRGMALELIYAAFRNRTGVIDNDLLLAMMQGLGQSLGEDAMIFVLRSLGDRKYITYDEVKDKKTNEVRIQNLRITPLGCDVVERSSVDPAVLIL
jgi:hypothetical protein